MLETKIVAVTFPEPFKIHFFKKMDFSSKSRTQQYPSKRRVIRLARHGFEPSQKGRKEGKPVKEKPMKNKRLPF